MGIILSLILSKFGAIFAGAIGILGLWLYGRAQKSRADKAQLKADGYQAQAEIEQAREPIQQKTQEEVEDVHKKVDSGDAAGVADEFNSLRYEK